MNRKRLLAGASGVVVTALSTGISFLGALQGVLIGLKLAGYVDLAWWQVLLPLVIVIVLYFLEALTE